ncbi:MAG: hypothetical protein IKZ82_11385 [Clostridia bacterium]|nr:hypothetical protein [Clostridia bacterium]
MTANDNSTIELNTSSPAPQVHAAEERSSTASAPVLPESSADARIDEEPRLPWYKRAFFRKLGYALIALLISVTVWGYVLMSENPVRIKRIEDVRLSIDGASEANLRIVKNLIVSDDLSRLLPTVAVSVETRLNQLPRFDSAVGDVVTASITLSDINGPGEYEIPIRATSTIGTPVSVDPSTVTITVESYVTRDIPITYSFENSLPDGYWHGEPEFRGDDTMTIEGAESKISSIVKANCVIDLSGITESINESFEPVLLDEDHNELDKMGIVGIVPSVIVRMKVLPYEDIPVEDFINYAGEINENYEITSVSINPQILTVAAPRETLDAIGDTIYIEPINVSNLYPSTHQQRVSFMGITSDMKLLSDNSFIVTVDVADKMAQRTIVVPFEDVVIEGEDTMLFSYLYGTRSFSVQLSGPARIVNSIKQSDISLYLNVRGLARGTHEIIPSFSVEGEPPWLYDGSVAVTVQRSFCTITTAPTNAGSNAG